MRGKLEGLCVRYLRQAMTPESKALVLKELHALKDALAARDNEKYRQADMRLHRTIWRLSGKPQLYRTLSFVMNPLFFMVAHAYSLQLNPPEESYQAHEQYVQLILTAPVGRVKREVEKYFANLYKRLEKTVLRRPAAVLEGFEDDGEEFSFGEDSQNPAHEP